MRPIILIDMNLTPDWVDTLQTAGLSVIHCRSVGPTTAPDHDVMDYARKSGHVVMTLDLDFTVLLAMSHAVGPSVVQIRARNSRPPFIGPQVINALNQNEGDLTSGAIVVVDEYLNRVRVIPL